MAKEVKVTNTKVKEATFKEKLFQTIGQLLASEIDNDVTHLKMKGTPECLLIMDDDKQYALTITLKKNPIKYEDEDVVNTYSPVYGDYEEVDEIDDDKELTDK